MIGAIIGDIVGSRFEFNNHRSTDFELFHPTCTFTDDTICTIAVADWLMNYDKQSLKKTMRYWCKKYPSSYGGMFGRWIHDGEMGPYGSYGNGSAMRVSPVAWAFDNLNAVRIKSTVSAVITHNHPEGIKGAQCIALSILHLRRGLGKKALRLFIESKFGYNLAFTCAKIRKTNQFDETCQVTVPQAIQCLLESTDFESAIRLAVSIGGDSDTIAAITGSLAEAHYGIPEELKTKALTYLPADMIEVINQFNKSYGNIQIL